MADFTQSSKYNKNANMDSVKFGADAPLLETELNELQDIQNEARADVVRESTHSGFTTLGEIDHTHNSTTPNTIRLRTESTAFVNGYKITIPANTDITLPEPPTKDFTASNGRKGWREDLVFLEVWREEIDHTKTIDSLGRDGAGGITNYLRDNRVGVETSRRTQLKYRIRSVSDINFTTAEEGVNLANARGALATESTTKFSKDSKDVGMYRATVTNAGVGNLVYAIPMFKVERRNSGEYSVNNANGAYVILPPYTTLGGTSTIPEGETRQITYPFDIANRITVRERLHRLGSTNPASAWRVISIDSPNTITVESLSGGTAMGLFPLYQDTSKFFGRPDKLFNNIIADRDIIDLRHKVSLTGFDYQQLLEENFDKLLRGELQTKERTKMKKTYFGIPKTPIDSNTIFYASFDGTTVAEVGGETSTNRTSFRPCYSGLGLYVNNRSMKSKDSSITLNIAETNNLTLDYNVDLTELVSGYNAGLVTTNVGAVPNNNNHIIGLYLDRTNFNLLQIRVSHEGGSNMLLETYNLSSLKTKGISNYKDIRHIRTTFSNGIFKVYINGNIIINSDMSTYITTLSVERVALNGFVSDTQNITISDLHISNIDRGDNFATLPQDFIDGYADIVPAFNSQRDYFADPLTSQFTTEIVKASGTNERQITTTQATSGVWNSGDTIKVKGLTGEILSGVIDSDTALATLVQNLNGNGTSTNNIMYLNSVSKISIGDQFRIADRNFVLSSNLITVTAIDSVNNSITFDSAIAVEASTWSIGYHIIETTASTSSPTVKFNNGTTLTNVTGTWSGLGTNEMTFTIGTNAELTNQDIQIEYSCNMIAGQGQVPVYNEVLQGEINGKKLIPQSSVTIVDDFKGKVFGSTSANPHDVRGNVGQTSLQTPTGTWNASINQSWTDRLTSLDGTTSSTSTTVNGAMAQQLFSFNIIEIVERKYGKIPAIDKVKWLKDNIVRFDVSHYGYGNCPTGDKLVAVLYRYDVNLWDPWFKTRYINNSNVTIKSSRAYTTNRELFISPNGYITLLTYTDPSDGETASTIYTDYVNIEVTLKTTAFTDNGYKILAPENNRAREDKSGILLVRPETKEVVRYPLGEADNNSGVKVWGDYVPYQGSTIRRGVNFVTDANVLIGTTLGTGQVNTNTTFARNLYRNCISRLPVRFNRDHSYNNEDLECGDSDSTAGIVRVPIINQAKGSGEWSNFISHYACKNMGMSSTLPPDRGATSEIIATSGYVVVKGLANLKRGVNFVSAIALLIRVNGELQMVIATNQLSGVWFGVNTHRTQGNTSADTFKLNESPLIKGGN